MLTFRQALRTKGSAGDPLPVVFRSIADKGAQLLRGQLCLISAGSGTGKSAFVLTYVLRAGVPTLYFSADSDQFTQITRGTSILTGRPVDEVAEEVRNDELDPALDGTPIRFDFGTLTRDRISQQLRSYEELAGDFPEVIVIDNISDIQDKDESSLEFMTEELHGIARSTGALVIALHHVKGEYNDGDKPVPLSGVREQISRVPELILTLHRVKQSFGSDKLRVSVVKNRGGRSNSSGWDYAELEFLGDVLQIRDAE